MAYTVFESINMGSTHYAERIFDCVCDKDVENGTFGYMDGLAEGYDHVYKFAFGTKDGAAIVVADQPAWNEDECRITNQRRDNFIIPAGTPFRVRIVKENDEFGITINGFVDASKETVKNTSSFVDTDVFVTIDASGKLSAASAAIDGAPMNAKIMRKRILGGTLVTPIRTYGDTTTMYEVKIQDLA